MFYPEWETIHLTLENKYIDKSSSLNYDQHQQFKSGALCN